jgi:hypothetical protein
VTSRAAAVTPLWLRYAAILVGILFLVWLPLEDTHEGWVISLSAAFCAWWAARYLSMPNHSVYPLWLRYTAAGFIAGISITPLALLLMVFKNGVHGHEFPDFSPQQMAWVVEYTPVWASAGILIGLGAGIWKMARSR